MRFVVVGTKRAGADSVRSENRVAHLRYMIESLPSVVFGGSFVADDGSWAGMVLVVDQPDEATMRAWLASEPYTRAGLFQSIDARPFRLMVPEPADDFLARELAAELAVQTCAPGGDATSGADRPGADRPAEPGTRIP